MADDDGTSKVTVGVVIRHARQQAGLSGRKLSRLAGLSEGYVTKVESGEVEPSLAAFAKIALTLKMTPLEVYFCVVTQARQHG